MAKKMVERKPRSPNGTRTRWVQQGLRFLPKEQKMIKRAAAKQGMTFNGFAVFVLLNAADAVLTRTNKTLTFGIDNKFDMRMVRTNGTTSGSEDTSNERQRAASTDQGPDAGASVSAGQA